MNEKEKYLQEMIDEIEEFVEDGKQSRFNPGKVTLDSEILMTMLEELRSHVPTEIERGHQIVQSKQDIIDDAKIQADNILKNAIKEASVTVEENEIVKLAKRRAEDIEQKSNQYAEDLVAKAKAEAKEIRLGAMEYTKDILSNMEAYMESLKKAQESIYSQLLDGIEADIVDLRDNNAQMDEQIRALERAGMPKARTIEDL
jgi:hypothetical protein